MTTNNMVCPPPPKTLIDKLVTSALEEDLGEAGDVTTNSIFPAGTIGQATITAREAGVLAGTPFADAVFEKVDTGATIQWHKTDGNILQAGDIIAQINAKVRTILSAERTALNFLGHLSGIATTTHRFVKLVEKQRAKITDTRKTTPGLRGAEKYAVRAGGGANHRFSLADAVLIKDNHIAFAGSITQAIKKARAAISHMTKIEVEVDTLDQLRECLKENIDAVLLDNMPIEQLKEAVAMIDGQCISEASGGVSIDTVEQIAATGVDYISIGALTHSARTLDLGLDVDISTN